MFVPVQDGTAFQEQKYSKTFYYLSVAALVGTCLLFLGGSRWVVLGLGRLLREETGKPKQPEYRTIENDFEEDYWHYYPYFKIKKRDTKKEGPETPAKKVGGMGVFSVIKNRLHHDRYAPMV
jgi:hypothetical protein